MKINRDFAPITITLESKQEKQWLLTVLSEFAQGRDANSMRLFRGCGDDYSQQAKNMYKRLDS